MERNGTFENTKSLEGFMKAGGIVKLDLAKNPNTGKFFVSATDSEGGTSTMRVSNKLAEELARTGKFTGEEKVSWFTPADGEEPSFMLHPEGELTPAIASFSLVANLQEA